MFSIFFLPGHSWVWEELVGGAEGSAQEEDARKKKDMSNSGDQFL